ncbi:MAG: hypothetical protein ACI854_002025 [Arenicella sp.]|jgi:hypothetical protein
MQAKDNRTSAQWQALDSATIYIPLPIIKS